MGSPLASVPFIVKLLIAIVLDVLSAGLIIAGFVLPVIDDVVNAGLAVLFLSLFYNYRMPVVMGWAIVEAVPILNVVPTCSIMALWNGYKTKWRY